MMDFFLHENICFGNCNREIGQKYCIPDIKLVSMHMNFGGERKRIGIIQFIVLKGEMRIFMKMSCLYHSDVNIFR